MLGILNDEAIEVPSAYAAHALYNFGVYTSFPVRDGTVLGIDAHLRRLERDAKNFLGVGVCREAIVRNVRKFIGTPARPGEVTVRVTIFPTDFSLAAPHKVSAASILVTGRQGSSIAGSALRLHTIECHRPFAEFKSTSIAPSMKVRSAAKKLDFDDALMHVNGVISEGPTWNIFFVENGKIVTPGLDCNILPGITRDIVLKRLSLDVIETRISLEALSGFRAAFVTNAAIGIASVAGIDDLHYVEDHPVIGHIKTAYVNLARDQL